MTFADWQQEKLMDQAPGVGDAERDGPCGDAGLVGEQPQLADVTAHHPGHRAHIVSVRSTTDPDNAGAEHCTFGAKPD
jgi:hypothetical protein